MSSLVVEVPQQRTREEVQMPAVIDAPEDSVKSAVL
jgi:hypothetical protein